MSVPRRRVAYKEGLWHLVVPSAADGQVTADRERVIRVELCTNGLSAGPYRLVATGVWSGQVAAVDLAVP